MPADSNITMIDNPAINGRENAYASITVDVAKTLRSWKSSLFSFEWLRPDGTIKDAAEMAEAEQIKRARVEEKIKTCQPIEKPVLGIGIMENVEIGIGRAEFLTLAAQGIKEIEVHIPKSGEADFKPFLSGVK